jgi:predicted dehydrogenase
LSDGLNRLRVGLIGIGGVGRLHLEAYRRSAAVEVVALCDADPKRVAEAAATCGAATYTDHQSMLAAESLDIVCILTPPASRLRIVADVASAGVAILIEKPMATTRADAEEMRRLCDDAGVTLGYGASYRHLPALKHAHDLIVTGAIGDVILLREDFIGGRGPASRTALPPWHYPAGGIGGTGMGLVDHGVHLIDAFAWLAGSPVAWASGRGNRSGDALETEYAVLGLANGATGHLIYEDGTWPTQLPGEGQFSWGASWDQDGYHPGGMWQAHPGSIHVHGTRGALRIFHYAHALYLTDAEGTRQIALEGDPAPDHFRAQIDAFAAELMDNMSPTIGADAGIAALTVLEAIYASAGRNVAIEA